MRVAIPMTYGLGDDMIAGFIKGSVISHVTYSRTVRKAAGFS